MPDQIFLTIVTNNPDEAIGDALCCALTNKPKWVRIVSDPLEILALTSGTRCVALWYSGRKKLCPAEQAWRERRMMGGLKYLDDADYERIRAWIEKHKAKMRAEAGIPVSVPPAITPERDSVLPHPQPELQKLVLTQRWT